MIRTLVDESYGDYNLVIIKLKIITNKAII